MNSGCSLYQVDIQQGNYITSEQVAQVRTGMTQEQVKELLGTPLMTDDFRQNRWDYVFYRKSGNGAATQSGITVFFDGNGIVNDLVKS